MCICMCLSGSGYTFWCLGPNEMITVRLDVGYTVRVLNECAYTCTTCIVCVWVRMCFKCRFSLPFSFQITLLCIRNYLFLPSLQSTDFGIFSHLHTKAFQTDLHMGLFPYTLFSFPPFHYFLFLLYRSVLPSFSFSFTYIIVFVWKWWQNFRLGLYVTIQ